MGRDCRRERKPSHYRARPVRLIVACSSIKPKPYSLCICIIVSGRKNPNDIHSVKGEELIQGILEHQPFATSKSQDVATPIASCQGVDITAA